MSGAHPFVAGIEHVAERIDAADQFVELEYGLRVRFSRKWCRASGSACLGHFLEAERGNDFFVVTRGSGSVGEYNATTGAVINASFITGLPGPIGLAVAATHWLVVTL